MDFSGKSTIAKLLHEKLPNSILRHKFISSNEDVLKFRHDYVASGTNNIWYDTYKEWEGKTIPKFAEVAALDIEHYRDEGKILIVDNLTIFKWLIGMYKVGGTDNDEYVIKCKKLIAALPAMTSYYVTASIEEKLRRAKKRKQETGPLSKSDSVLVDDIENYNERERICKKLVFGRFPHTKIIDTSATDSDEIVAKILEEIK